MNSGKKQKKAISRLWKSACRQIQEGRPPSKAEADRLLRQCDDYNMYAEPVWAPAWRTCCTAVRQCLALAATGDFAGARALMDEANRQTKACHKKYK